jgi:hypothetical protein
MVTLRSPWPLIDKGLILKQDNDRQLCYSGMCEMVTLRSPWLSVRRGLILKQRTMMARQLYTPGIRNGHTEIAMAFSRGGGLK